MPFISERQLLLSRLYKLAKYYALFDDAEGFNDTIEMIYVVEKNRYLGDRKYANLRKHLRMNGSIMDMMSTYDERSFRQTVRMGKTSFLKLVDRLSDDPVFKTGDEHGRHKQAPVWVQLMIVLQRLGCYGNGAAAGRLATNGGFSSGSVHKFTDRVYRAIRNLRRQAITWPDAEERQRISGRMDVKFGLPGGIGVIDGTPVVFAQRPAIDGETFWTRKCHYAYNLQLICDDLKRIRWYNCGWPGSVFDASVFDSTDLRKNHERYFSPGEFLLADAGYAALSFVCVPYKQPWASLPNNWLFNKLFSRARVCIEHVNGLVKARWMSLKGIRIQVKQKRDFKRVCHHVEVCLILHNLMIDFDDDWDEDIEVEEEEAGNVDHLIDEEDDEVSGQELRRRVQNYLLGWYHAQY